VVVHPQEEELPCPTTSRDWMECCTWLSHIQRKAQRLHSVLQTKCARWKETTYICETCDRKPGLHVGTCFKWYHTLKKLKL